MQILHHAVYGRDWRCADHRLRPLKLVSLRHQWVTICSVYIDIYVYTHVYPNYEIHIQKKKTEGEYMTIF